MYTEVLHLVDALPDQHVERVARGWYQIVTEHTSRYMNVLCFNDYATYCTVASTACFAWAVHMSRGQVEASLFSSLFRTLKIVTADEFLLVWVWVIEVCLIAKAIFSEGVVGDSSGMVPSRVAMDSMEQLATTRYAQGAHGRTGVMLMRSFLNAAGMERRLSHTALQHAVAMYTQIIRTYRVTDFEQSHVLALYCIGRAAMALCEAHPQCSLTDLSQWSLVAKVFPFPSWNVVPATFEAFDIKYQSLLRAGQLDPDYLRSYFELVSEDSLENVMLKQVDDVTQPGTAWFMYTRGHAVVFASGVALWTAPFSFDTFLEQLQPPNLLSTAASLPLVGGTGTNTDPDDLATRRVESVLRDHAGSASSTNLVPMIAKIISYALCRCVTKCDWLLTLLEEYSVPKSNHAHQLVDIISRARRLFPHPVVDSTLQYAEDRFLDEVAPRTEQWYRDGSNGDSPTAVLQSQSVLRSTLLAVEIASRVGIHCAMSNRGGAVRGLLLAVVQRHSPVLFRRSNVCVDTVMLCAVAALCSLLRFSFGGNVSVMERLVEEYRDVQYGRGYGPSHVMHRTCLIQGIFCESATTGESGAIMDVFEFFHAVFFPECSSTILRTVAVMKSDGDNQHGSDEPTVYGHVTYCAG